MCVCVCVRPCAHVQLCPTLCDCVDCSPPVSSVHRILRQECWSRLPFLTSRIFLNQGLNSCLLCPQHWQADSFTTAPPEPLTHLPVSPFALPQEFSLHTLPKGSFSNITELITSVVISGGFPDVSSGKESIFQCRRCKKWV